MRILLTALVVTLVGCTSGSPKEDVNWEQRLREAEKIRAENPDAPIPGVVQRPPRRVLEWSAREQAQIFYEEAVRHYQESNFQKAEISVQRALQLYPTHPEAQRLLDDIRRVRS
jgi:hypothetical protein